jgi:group I intron endonuclease
MKLRDDMLPGVIYKITNVITKKSYVGKCEKSRELFLRSKYYGSGKYIKASIKKHGLNNFTREVLEDCDISIIKDREKFWIKELNTLIPYGYNISKGGDGGFRGSTSEQAKRGWITRRLNGTDIVKPETIAKIIKTKRDKGCPLGFTIESHRKGVETRRKNNSFVTGAHISVITKRALGIPFCTSEQAKRNAAKRKQLGLPIGNGGGFCKKFKL